MRYVRSVQTVTPVVTIYSPRRLSLSKPVPFDRLRACPEFTEGERG